VDSTDKKPNLALESYTWVVKHAYYPRGVINLMRSSTKQNHENMLLCLKLFVISVWLAVQDFSAYTEE